ncbi:MAG: hypothetical protein KDB27_17450 [Planctomycetales bacterium]|nr:hypothetical protein [Planctomycetales bacterium]
MIKNLQTSYLQNTELTVVAQRLLDVVTEALPTEPSIQNAAEAVRLDIQQVNAALNRLSASEYTAQLAERDEVRDQAFIALRDFAKAYSSRPVADLSAAGTRIYELFVNHGLTAYRSGYTDQSAEMILLIEQLSEPEAQQALDTIGAGAWFEELRDAQSSFEQVMKAKAQAKSDDDTPAVREARSDLIRNVDTLLGTIDVLKKLEDRSEAKTNLETLDDLIIAVNEIITDVTGVARARRTREEAAEPDSQTLAASIAP